MQSSAQLCSALECVIEIDVTQAGEKSRLLGQLQAQQQQQQQPQASRRHAAVHNKSNSYIIIISNVVGSAYNFLLFL